MVPGNINARSSWHPPAFEPGAYSRFYKQVAERNEAERAIRETLSDQANRQGLELRAALRLHAIEQRIELARNALNVWRARAMAVRDGFRAGLKGTDFSRYLQRPS